MLTSSSQRKYQSWCEWVVFTSRIMVHGMVRESISRVMVHGIVRESISRVMVHGIV